jgi:hypothetical protein
MIQRKNNEGHGGARCAVLAEVTRGTFGEVNFGGKYMEIWRSCSARDGSLQEVFRGLLGHADNRTARVAAPGGGYRVALATQRLLLTIVQSSNAVPSIRSYVRDKTQMARMDMISRIWNSMHNINNVLLDWTEMESKSRAAKWLITTSHVMTNSNTRGELSAEYEHRYATPRCQD